MIAAKNSEWGGWACVPSQQLPIKKIIHLLWKEYTITIYNWTETGGSTVSILI
jgi:hypothetical protein